MRRFILVLGAFTLISAAGRPVQAAQVEGHAEISRPATGDTVSGVVTILGSASSPRFDHFELSFGYDPNPTDTWFPIGDAISTQVSFGRLGLWDTTRITDGAYSLRLIVTLDDGSLLEDVVEGIEVRSSGAGRLAPVSGTPRASESTVIAGSISAATPTLAAVGSLEEPQRQAPPDGRAIDVSGVTLAGAGAAVFSLLGLAVYVEIRRSLRRRWSSIQSRRLHTGSRAGDRQEGGRS